MIVIPDQCHPELVEGLPSSKLSVHLYKLRVSVVKHNHGDIEDTEIHRGYFEAPGFQESFSVTVRLKTILSSDESLSSVKYPLRKN